METKEWDIREYLRLDGKCPFRNWLSSLKDVKARAKIRVRINRLRLGNFGDCKSVGSGVVNFESTMDRDIEFILVVLVKN